MVSGSCAEQGIQGGVRGGGESEFLAVAEEAGQDMGSEQLLRKVSCRETSLGTALPSGDVLG